MNYNFIEFIQYNDMSFLKYSFKKCDIFNSSNFENCNLEIKSIFFFIKVDVLLLFRNAPRLCTRRDKRCSFSSANPRSLARNPGNSEPLHRSSKARRL